MINVKAMESIVFEAMTTAVQYASNEHSAWCNKAFAMFSLFLKYRAGEEAFTVEEVREFATAQGLESPPDKRSWGGITGRMIKAGRIRSAGFVNCKDPLQHGKPTRMWKKRELH